MPIRRALSRNGLLLAGACALALGGCAVGPAYQPPSLALNAGFHTPAPIAAPGAQSTDMAAWWWGFGDPELSRVVERAMDQNLDLAQARAQVLQSRAAARAAGAALLPHGEANGSVGRGEQSLLSPIGEIGRRLPGYQRDQDLYDVGAAASWEIDLFGGLRRGREAARAEALASRDQAEAVRISIAAEAADAYLRVRADQARLAVARRQEQVRQDLVGLLTRRVADEIAPEREL
ncbi:MAG: TolC family protein, partial [Caulobacteraceae bacterium]|nr:TolC family protein [Caulobacteraceae bacterium]